MASQKTTRAIYWGTTGPFCLFLGGSGLAYLASAAPIVEGLTHLGFPLYLLWILGVAKVAGVIVLLAPGLPVLKEWAYAGFAIDLIGAVASHAFVGDAIGEVLPPGIILLVCAASYLHRPASRRVSESLSMAPAN